MRITRIYLRNFRVYEELDLEMPAGVVGIFGPNGSGKSSLIESLLWTLWGRSRTRNEDVRTTGVNADCITEVEFEHEGHLYSVRRTITGINSTVRAEAFADRQQVASGVRDVKQYVHSVLGMDDAAFRASVFAEQKQVAAFSTKTPRERRDLVLKLLGITPLDDARDEARKDAKAARDRVEYLRGMLHDVDELKAGAELAVAVAESSAMEAAAEADVASKARQRSSEAESAFTALDGVRQEHDALVSEGLSVRAEVDLAAARVAQLTAELAELAALQDELERLRPDAGDVGPLEDELRLLRAVVTAATALDALPSTPEPARADDEAVETARAAAASARGELDTVAGQVQAADDEVERARRHLDRSAALSAEGDCPLCGQALGDAFAQVQAHRRQELAEAEGRHGGAEAKRRHWSIEVEARAAALEAAALAHKTATRAWQAFERLGAQRATAEVALAAAVAALEATGRQVGEVGIAGGAVAVGVTGVAQTGRLVVVDDVAAEAATLEADLVRRRVAARRCDVIEGTLGRWPVAEKQLAEERHRHVGAEGRRGALLDKVRGLGFDRDALQAMSLRRDEARQRAERTARASDDARVAAERLRLKAEFESLRVAEAEAQHAALAGEAEGARHLSRLAELLNTFRTNVVATVGPRLSAQAAELFDELTDHEYDLLQVDPETYEIQIVDGGRTFGMDRFSGSETDLANLALRVAISEHVRFQSGGAVGLLVLDEVFGPLDDDRKERMLLALERLRARFGQVLVVTHATDIKEQMPSAVEVVKLPGRRATARVVGV